VQRVARDVLDLVREQSTEGQAVHRTGLSRLEVRDLRIALECLLTALARCNAGCRRCAEKQREERAVLQVLLGFDQERELQQINGYAEGADAEEAK
jgi:hypothetical protein